MAIIKRQGKRGITFKFSVFVGYDQNGKQNTQRFFHPKNLLYPFSGMSVRIPMYIGKNACSSNIRYTNGRSNVTVRISSDTHTTESVTFAPAVPLQDTSIVFCCLTSVRKTPSAMLPNDALVLSNAEVMPISQNASLRSTVSVSENAGMHAFTRSFV